MTGPHPTDMQAGVARWVVGTAVAGTVLIALGAFWLSFTALTDLARRAGIPTGQAWVWPLIVDGIIVVATTSVVALAPGGRRATWYPWALLLCGAAVSVAGNATHAVLASTGDLPGVLAAAISAVPPLVLLAITHLTVALTTHTRHEPPTVASPAEDTSTAVEPSNSVPDRARPASPTLDSGSKEARVRAALAWRAQGWSNKRIARRLGVHPSTVGRWFATRTEAPPSPTGT